MITGAANGIGRACAVRFAAEGAAVVAADAVRGIRVDRLAGPQASRGAVLLVTAWQRRSAVQPARKRGPKSRAVVAGGRGRIEVLPVRPVPRTTQRVSGILHSCQPFVRCADFDRGDPQKQRTRAAGPSADVDDRATKDAPTGERIAGGIAFAPMAYRLHWSAFGD